MKTLSGEEGGNTLLIPVIVLALLLVAALAFGGWAFSGRQDYKNNVDTKIAAAQDATKKSVETTDEANFAEQYKSPTKLFKGPSDLGSVQVSYPKTWSAYVDTTNSNTPLDAYFHDDYVPSVQSKSTYNLRIQVIAKTYDSVAQQYASKVKQGIVTTAPYTSPNVTSAQTGSILTGHLFSDPTQSGTMVLLPLRTTTLAVWVESPDYLGDFNKYILPSLTFSP